MSVRALEEKHADYSFADAMLLFETVRSICGREMCRNSFGGRIIATRQCLSEQS